MTSKRIRAKRANRRLNPAKPRKAKPALTVAAKVEPTGLAAVMAVQGSVEGQERERARAAVQVDVQEGMVVGDHGPVDIRPAIEAEFGVSVTHDRALPGVPFRANSRDGLLSLYRSTALAPHLLKAGLAYRLCYEAAGKGLGSGLGNAGEGGGGSRKMTGLARSAAELHRAYLLIRLNQMERAVGDAMVDGRELHALRTIAGEGKTVREVVGSNSRARKATTEALVRALDAIATALRIRGQ